ncbi:hypothetical protein JXL21_09520 [Candidatus Bathyarchaeota archaeon]|nr:hypothetical protein [Candidatus Bathyarchaeota archaeon]
MRTRRTSCRRKAVSTILGTLIFIGIMFSAVVPMFLVMKQADTVLEQKKLEIRRQDDEKSREDMDIFAYPVSGESQLEVKVNSKSEVPINIIRLWINNTIMDLNVTVLPMEQDKILGPYNVPTQAGTDSEFSVKMTSARGNVYDSQAGMIIYDGTEADWHTESLRIVAFVGQQGSIWFGFFGSYRTTLTRDSPYYYDQQTLTWTVGTCMFTFDVTDTGPGTYHLLVERRTGGWWSPQWSSIYDEDVTITWPGGPAVVEIYV